MNANQFTRFMKLIEDAGWVFAVPEMSSNEEVPGMIIGTPEYVEAVVAQLPDDLLLATPPTAH